MKSRRKVILFTILGLIITLIVSIVLALVVRMGYIFGVLIAVPWLTILLGTPENIKNTKGLDKVKLEF